MRSWSRIAGWTSYVSRIAGWTPYVVAAAATLTLACGGGGDSGPQLNGIAFANGTFVAVGESAEAYVNTGAGWTPFATGVGSLEAVAYAADQGSFVAVGDGGAIVTSPDGTSWTQQLSPTPANLHGVTAGFGRIVAVGDGGTILESSDGAVWTPRASGTDAALFGVGVGSDRFLAVGAGGTVVSSTDLGLTWTSSVTGRPNDLYAVAFGVDRWVTCGADGSVQASVTSAGSSWQVAAEDVLPNLNDVIFTQGIFVVVGDEGVVLTSPNGGDYGQSVTDSGQFLFGVAFGNGGFIAVASGGHVFTSIDAAIWQEGKI